MRIWKALATLAVVAVVALGLLAIGSAHRDRCLRAGNAGCSLIPWSGHAVSNGLGDVIIPGRN